MRSGGEEAPADAFGIYQPTASYVSFLYDHRGGRRATSLELVCQHGFGRRADGFAVIVRLPEDPADDPDSHARTSPVPAPPLVREWAGAPKIFEVNHD